MHTISFQVPDDMKERLDYFAKQLERSKGYLMRQAVAEYLEDLQDYLEAKSYKSKYNPAENVSLEDLKRRHDLD